MFEARPSPSSAVDPNPMVVDPTDSEIVMLEVADEASLTPPSRGRYVAAVVSLVLHIWVLSNLAQTVFQQENYYEPPLTSHLIDEDVNEPEPIPEEVKYELANPDDRETEIREVLNASSVGLMKTTTPKLESQPRLVVQDTPTPVVSSAVYDIPEGVEVDSRVVVHGTNGNSLVQIDSAMDLVTWEIAKNLQEQRVLVVWLLDASASLIKQKEQIAKRLKRVYGELDALDKSDQLPRHEVPVLSGVVSFGERTTFMTNEPTAEFQKILSAVENTPIDNSGVENVFGSVHQVLQRWASFRTNQHRRIMLITLTDEAGDDFGDWLEKSIVQCQRYGAKAYVIGPAAVFGRRDGFIPYTAPEDGKNYRLPVAIGPEVPVFDTLDLPFWYDGPQYDYLSSGFAPYALARMVHETGGVYFLTNMTTMSGLTPIGTYDLATLKPYEPDYSFGSPEDYEKDLRKHPLRAAVVQAAQLSRKFTAKGTPTLDLRVTAANFKNAAGDAQKSVAESQLMVDLVLQAMPDSLEKHLERETSGRWRLNYCLTYGRLLAHKVRCQEYNLAFAWIKNDLTADDINKKSNHWIVKPDKTINYAGNMRKTAAKAEEYLSRIIREAPGTPWAVLAQRELKDGFGVRIDQKFIPPPPPPPPRPAAPPGKTVLFAPEPEKPKPAAPKPPPPPKPVLPKL